MLRLLAALLVSSEEITKFHHPDLRLSKTITTILTS